MARISPTPVPTLSVVESLNRSVSPSLGHPAGPVGTTEVSATGSSLGDDVQGEAAQIRECSHHPIVVVCSYLTLFPGALEDDLYVVRSTFLFPPPAVPGNKPSKKMNSTVKIFTTDVETIKRVDFINACFLAHSLSHTFTPGAVSGPRFLMHWHGSFVVLFLCRLSYH